MQKLYFQLLFSFLFLCFSQTSNAQNFTFHIIYGPEETQIKCVKGCNWDVLKWNNSQLQSEVFFNHIGSTQADKLKESKFLIGIVFLNNIYHVRGIKKTKWQKIQCVVAHPNDIFVIDKKNVQLIRNTTE